MSKKEKTVSRESLTPENFFNDLNARCPEGLKIFSDWINRWKDTINWNKIFTETRSKKDSGSIKRKIRQYQELPYCLQLGIWLEFVCERGGCQFPIDDFFEFDLREDISNYVEYVLQPEAIGAD